MPKLKINLKRRWVRSRPGSVLILVIALLVLLALIGTAYLSSTQTERYTSVQNTINTQADLLIEGLQTALYGQIASSVNGIGMNGQQYRPPLQDMPLPKSTSTQTGYANYDGTSADLFLGDRIPTIPLSTAVPTWAAISWPMFADSSGNETFDSPFENSLTTYLAANKGLIVAVPGSKTVNSQIYPTLAFYVPSPAAAPVSIQTSPGVTQPISSPGEFFNPTVPTGLSTTRYDFTGASASGDGIADSAMFKLPVGQIDGITYYAATRVIDNNSAVNASTAWTSASDPLVTNVSDSSLTSGTPINHGFFRSNIGLREILFPGTVAQEMNNLNSYRFNGVIPPQIPATANSTPALGLNPVGDDGTNRTDFSWYSAGDALEQQLARRPYNPGFNTANNPFFYIGKSQSGTLAYKFSLLNPSGSPSLVEDLFPSETYTYSAARSTPYSPSQVVGSTLGAPGYWFGDLFNFSTTTNMPLRTVLTCDNPVSNAVPSVLGNSASPTAFRLGGQYNFGDWVINTADPTLNPSGDNRTYVCLLANAGTQAPQPFSNTVGSDQYWAVVPWTRQPVKASINTATFEQLYVNFCQVMTDSLTAAYPKQWNPPLLPATPVSNTVYPEQQMPMFRSSIRDNRSVPISNTTNTGNPVTSPTSSTRIQLTPMQEMQLRAGLAAINTITMRNATTVTANHQVRSRRIVLQDNTGALAYDAELFGTDIQPYIGQMYSQVQDTGGAGTKNFIAIQLLNPYSIAINVTKNWGLATIDRSKTGLNAMMQPQLMLTSVLPTGTPLSPFTIPAAATTGGAPGIVIIYDGTPPTNFNPPVSSTNPQMIKVDGLLQAIGKEFIILKPRLLNGNPSSESTSLDSYAEADSTGNPQLWDLVPVDQLDMTGTDKVTLPANLYYRRAADPAVNGGGTNSANFSWNFVWPGFYTPYNPNNPSTLAGAQTPPSYTPSAVPVESYPFNQSIVNASAPSATNGPDFTKVGSGPADPTASTPTAPTYNTISMQLNNVGFPGPNPVATTGNQFPFGGFARNLDMLQIPFIGAYRISLHGAPPSATVGFFEMNSVTMDSSLANDSTLQPNLANTNYSTTFPSKVIPATATYSAGAVTVNADAVTDPFVEQIGRFCPIGDTSPTAYNPLTTVLNNSKLIDFGTDNTKWHYHWAKRLLDYFTVDAPHDDYFPNVDPAVADTTATPAIPAKYPVTTPSPAVVPVKNSTSSAGANSVVAGSSEDTIGVEGLININTAPWPVLARLPFVKAGTDNITYTAGSGATVVTADGVDDNVNIAMAIVDYRQRNGPFKSITDLYNVPAVRLENDALLATDPGAALGDFSPEGLGASAGSTPDGVRFDFEERFLLLNNISNLITTRSDTFTCYVLLQGWRNVGTGNPTLAVQRRIAFLVDRTNVTPVNNQPSVFNIPSQ